MDRQEWNQNEWEMSGRRRGGTAKVFLVIAVILLCAVIGLSAYNYMAPDAFEQSAGQVTPPQAAPEPVREAPAYSPPPERRPAAAYDPGSFGTGVMSGDTVRNIVQQCGDSVVLITTEILPASQEYQYNNPFPFYFGPQQPREGLGSGFIFREDGYILTNNHVVEKADKITVHLAFDENPYEASVVGRAPELDLAVIKIEGEGFPYLYIGDSDEVYVGDWVVAIGNPYGLDHTVTVGVISAMGRPLTIEGNLYQDLLQTDAAINPGNSGGPMLNLRGEVIGINTAVNAGAQGIGFAIPSRTVLDVLDDLEAGVEKVKPRIGISMLPMSRDMIQYFKIEDMTSGVIIDSVVAGAPADKAGLRRGDVLLEVDGQKVTDTSQVQSVIARRRVGDIVKIIVLRDGTEVEFMVELEASPEVEPAMP
ncbi:MAG: trypsin-like peptidase domain-containing protein [Clostridiales bacterium]|nr:trypsin-like peptidase domain-containing protein [Clostridiales bacterium]